MVRFALGACAAMLLLAGCGGDDPPVLGSGSSMGSSGQTGGGGDETSGSSGGDTGGPAESDDIPCDDPPALTFTKMQNVFGSAPMGGTFDEGNCVASFVTPEETDCGGESAALGASIGDFDGDGLQDVFFGNAFGPPRLMRNLGGGSFGDVASSVGIDVGEYSAGSAWFDADKDGDLDLYVLTQQGLRQRFYRNEGGSFVEDAEARGLDMTQPGNLASVSVAVGDYDLDGWPDLFVTGWRFSGPADEQPAIALFRNLGDANPGNFENLTVSAGLGGAAQYPVEFAMENVYTGYSSSFVDLDGDDHPDLVVAADFEGDTVYRNLGDGTFVDVGDDWGGDENQNAMGLAVGDFDRDGDMDIYQTSIALIHGSCEHESGMAMGNRLYMNRLGEGLPGDPLKRGEAEAVAACGAWGWGVAAADIDNDGDLDIAQTNGWFGAHQNLQIYDWDSDRLWISSGDPTDGMQHCGYELGLDDDGQGRTLLPFDYDDDGDLDLLVTRAGQSPLLYRNDGGNASDHLRVSLTGRESEASGRGARIALRQNPNQPWQVEEIGQAAHFGGHPELIAHYGLGSDAGSIHEVRVCWPVSGRMQILQDVTPNTKLNLDEDDADIVVDGPCATEVLSAAYD